MRKVIFLICTVIMVLGITNMAMGASEPKNIYYNQVVIQKGDTLWDIASENNNGDITTKEYVSIIKDLNSLDSDRILFGQKLIIPYYR